MSWISDLLGRRKSQPRLELTSSAAFELLKRETEGRWHFHPPLIRLADRGYCTITPDEAFACVRDAWTPYIKERNDCDDATYSAKHYAGLLGIKLPKPALLGIAHLTIGHAINFYVDPTAKLRWIDVRKGSEVKLTGELTLLIA